MPTTINNESTLNRCNVIIAALLIYVIFSNKFLSAFLGITPYSNITLNEKKESLIYISSIFFLLIINQLYFNFRKALLVTANIILLWSLICLSFSSTAYTFFDLPLSNIDPYRDLVLYFIFAVLSIALFDLKASISNLILLLAVWAACFKLFFLYDGHITTILENKNYFLGSPTLTILVSILIGLLWLKPEKIISKIPQWNFTKISITINPFTKFDLAIILLGSAIIGLYTNFFPQYAYAYNWTFYLGPIKSMREGFVLLFDNPSQYGFLNIIIPAVLPYSVEWSLVISVFTINVLYLLTIFYLLISPQKNKNIVHVCAAILIGTALLFVGDPLNGPTAWPSTAGYRFFPSLLSALLLGLWIRGVESQKLVISAYIVTYAVSTLWSFESAVFALIPPLSVLSVHFLITLTTKTEMARSQQNKKIFYLLLITVLCPLSSVCLVSFYYRLHFGFWPDWYSYVEYPITYSLQGFGTLPINPLGAVLFLGVLFSLLSYYLSLVFKEEKYAYFLMSLALVSYLLIVTTYFIGRSHDNNILNLLPLYFSVTAFIIASSYSVKLKSLDVLMKSLLHAIVVVVLLIASYDSTNWISRFNAGGKKYFDWYYSDKPLQDRLSLNIPPDSYLVDTSINQNDRESLNFSEYNNSAHYKKWLPAYPWDALGILEPSRASIYIDRALAKVKNNLMDKHRIFIITDSPTVTPEEKSKRNFELITKRLDVNGLKLDKGSSVKDNKLILYEVMVK